MLTFKHHLEVLYQSCLNYAPGVKIDPASGSQFYIELYKKNLQTTSFLEPLWALLSTILLASNGGSQLSLVSNVLC